MTVYVLFFVAVFLAHIVQGLSGFAGTVLAVSAGSFLVGLTTSVTVMNLVGVFAGIYIILVSWRHIRRDVLKHVFCVMIPGMALGFVLVRYLREYEKAQQLTLGLFIILAGLAGMLGRGEGLRFMRNSVAREAMLFIGGVFHGMYICGGTLLVLYISDALKKEEFRANISVVWVVLNSTVFLFHLYHGYWTPFAVKLTLGATPVVLLGVYVGGLLLSRISQAAFAVFTNALVLVSGMALVVGALR